MRPVHHHHPQRLAAAEIVAAREEAGPAEVTIELEASEIDWQIAGGRTIRAWGYNGTVPGPTIEARVGDVLSVRLKNSLREPTTIHWHGLRIPSAMDGTESTQPTIAPGETFEYRFRLPDAGTFWYHPHTNETVQLERGLYGALIVRGSAEPVVDRERVLLLDDIRLNRKGEIAAPGGWIERHNGREGKVCLVNGRADPVLEMAAGQVERWRIANVASARYFRLSLGGREFRVIGSDGGLIESPVTAREVLLAPADRVELLIGPFEAGETFSLEALPYNRGTGSRRGKRLARVVVGDAAPSVASIPARLRSIDPLASLDDPVTRIVHFGGKMTLRGIQFTMDGEPHKRAAPVRVGELQVWDIVNTTPIHHPFHLHGFFFQVLSVNDEPPAYRSWEDTVDLPPRSRVRIAWLPDDRPGEWMYHCHILEHHATGMMAHFEVVR